jgi:hypothetical protein
MGGRTLIPRSEIERLEHDERVRVMRTIGQWNEESGDLGRNEGMTPDELETLNAGCPGTLPWKQA